MLLLRVETERAVWRFPNYDLDDAGLGWLSATQLKEYLNCGLCYEARRVLRIPYHASEHFAIGGAVHMTAEMAGQLFLGGDPAPHQSAASEILGAAEVAFEENAEEVSHGGVELIPLDPVVRGAAKDKAMILSAWFLPEAVKLFHSRGLWNTEISFDRLSGEFGLANPFPFAIRGKVDAIFDDGTKVPLVTDWKTSARQERPALETRIQTALYGLYWHMNGFNVRLCVDVIGKTKTPSLRQYLIGDPSTGLVGPAAFQVTRDTIIRTADRICAGDFGLGPGWNGRHDYDHGLPEAHLLVA